MSAVRTHRRLAQEDGWILVTAMSLMAVMMMLALASLTVVDTQQKRSREQRERESALNLAETALYQHGFVLARNWPSQTAPASACSSASPVVPTCASNAQVSSNASNVDTQSATTWSTLVRDNGGPLGADTSTSPPRPAAWLTASANLPQPGCARTPCDYDANGDKKLWVYATATARGRTRSVVGTLRLEQLAESVPQTAVVAGGINTGNNGAQTKIFAQGSQVVVRCSPPSGNSGNSCVSDPRAIQPSAQQGTIGNLMTPEQIQDMKARAQADGTYYADCTKIPTGSGGSYNLSGQVVFVDKCYDSNAKLAFPNSSAQTCSGALPVKPSGAGNGLQPDCVNAMPNIVPGQKPGVVIWHCGGFGTAGKGTFIGLLYFVNGSDGGCPASGQLAPRGGTTIDCSGNNNSANNVLAMSGGLGILGAVAIDGNGCLYASANGIQVQFDPSVFQSVASYGTVGLVQDTWRELIPN